MIRRTKILATLGPASSNKEMLVKMILAGANAFRLNFSHGSSEDHIKTAQLIREVSTELDMPVAILGDLQGPKIRIAKFKEHQVEINAGDTFYLDLDTDKNAGTNESVNIDYKELVNDVKKGDILLLDDGKLQLEVIKVSLRKVQTKVLIGGLLSNNKGINKKGGGLTAPALTDKDMEDIKVAADIQVDYLAISFVQSPDDIRLAKGLLRSAGWKAAIISKIERADVATNLHILDSIIEASDGIMVARGDLGVEIGAAQLVGAQKIMLKRARLANKITITATQMMESMIENKMPTRAEVMDVANAVLDSTDAVMLSGETAMGKHPDLVVEAMADACLGAEEYQGTKIGYPDTSVIFKQTDIAIAMAAMNTANHLNGVKAMICLSESGNTPLWMSKIQSSLPIYALTPELTTTRKTCLYKGVHSIFFPHADIPKEEVMQRAIEHLKDRNILKDNDLVILTRGDNLGKIGSTNTMQIIVVN